MYPIKKKKKIETIRVQLCPFLLIALIHKKTRVDPVRRGKKHKGFPNQLHVLCEYVYVSFIIYTSTLYIYIYKYTHIHTTNKYMYNLFQWKTNRWLMHYHDDYQIIPHMNKNPFRHFVFFFFLFTVTSFRTFVNVIAAQWVWHTIPFFSYVYTRTSMLMYFPRRKWNLCIWTIFPCRSTFPTLI